jgi:hypothetical protein
MNQSSPSSEPSDDMRAADVANGENTADSSSEPDETMHHRPGPDQQQHRTGERQAQENVENDPPA